MWCAELLGRLQPEDRAGARGLKLAGTAQRAIARVARLLEDHLIVERIEAGGYPMLSQDVDLGEVLREAGARAELPGGLEVVAAAAAIQTDRALLLRAVEAMVHAAGGEGAAVRLRAETGPEGALVEVRGAALATAALDLPGRGAASDPSGRALGLAAARAIASSLGGSLEVVGGALVLRLGRMA
jgi:hypothetical protein